MVEGSGVREAVGAVILALQMTVGEEALYPRWRNVWIQEVSCKQQVPPASSGPDIERVQ